MPTFPHRLEQSRSTCCVFLLTALKQTLNGAFPHLFQKAATIWGIGFNTRLNFGVLQVELAGGARRGTTLGIVAQQHLSPTKGWECLPLEKSTRCAEHCLVFIDIASSCGTHSSGDLELIIPTLPEVQDALLTHPVTMAGWSHITLEVSANPNCALSSALEKWAQLPSRSVDSLNPGFQIHGQHWVSTESSHSENKHHPR